MAQALSLSVTAWSQLANGVLTGKYHGHGSSESGRMSADMMKPFMPEQQRTDHIIAAVKTVSDEIGRSMAQVALAWLRYRSVPVTPIIGARKLSHLQDNLASFNLTLSADQLRTLGEASRIELGFPQDFYAEELVPTLVYGSLRDQILAYEGEEGRSPEGSNSRHGATVDGIFGSVNPSRSIEQGKVASSALSFGSAHSDVSTEGFTPWFSDLYPLQSPSLRFPDLWRSRNE